MTLNFWNNHFLQIKMHPYTIPIHDYQTTGRDNYWAGLHRTVVFFLLSWMFQNCLRSLQCLRRLITRLKGFLVSRSILQYRQVFCIWLGDHYWLTDPWRWGGYTIGSWKETRVKGSGFCMFNVWNNTVNEYQNL